jgi:twitching motility protein PilT
MAAPGTARLDDPQEFPASGTEEVLAAIIRAHPHISDLIFSPGKSLQVQLNGELASTEFSRLPALTADDTRHIASDLLGNNQAAISRLREQGSCDVSYALPGVARFRVNVFIQRGSCAVVMRVIPTVIPDFKSLGLPEQLREIAQLREGMALITGPRGSGKSSTLAALLDHINTTESRHIITIEDPIEFLHNHKQSTVHQRELHSDTPTISQAMKAALRQAPNVIAVGELKDHATMELALEAAETGHLVLSTLITRSGQRALHKFVNTFPAGEQAAARERLMSAMRFLISQRLVTKEDRSRAGIFEVMRAGVDSFESLMHSPGA